MQIVRKTMGWSLAAAVVCGAVGGSAHAAEKTVTARTPQEQVLIDAASIHIGRSERTPNGSLVFTSPLPPDQSYKSPLQLPTGSNGARPLGK